MCRGLGEAKKESWEKNCGLSNLKHAQLGNLGDREQRVARQLTIKERVEFVLHNHAKSRQHRDAAVLQLSLAKSEISSARTRGATSECYNDEKLVAWHMLPQAPLSNHC